jgi:hypothetical protein
MLWLERVEGGEKVIKRMLKAHNEKERAEWEKRQAEHRRRGGVGKVKDPNQNSKKELSDFATLDNPELHMEVKAGYKNTAPLQETTLWELAAAELKVLTPDGKNKSGLYLIEDPDDPTAPKAVFAWVAKRHTAKGRTDDDAESEQAYGKFLRFPKNATERPRIKAYSLSKSKLGKGGPKVPVSLDFFLDDKYSPCRVPDRTPAITYQVSTCSICCFPCSYFAFAHL